MVQNGLVGQPPFQLVIEGVNLQELFQTDNLVREHARQSILAQHELYDLHFGVVAHDAVEFTYVRSGGPIVGLDPPTAVGFRKEHMESVSLQEHEGARLGIDGVLKQDEFGSLVLRGGTGIPGRTEEGRGIGRPLHIRRGLLDQFVRVVIRRGRRGRRAHGARNLHDGVGLKGDAEHHAEDGPDGQQAEDDPGADLFLPGDLPPRPRLLEVLELLVPK